MKHLTILVPNGQNNLSSIVGAYKIFSRANMLWRQRYRRDVFNIELAGLAHSVDFHNGLFTARTHKLVSQIKQTNLVIIPSLNHNYPMALQQNQELVAWIKNQYSNGAEVASICTGAFLLAATGLLNGKACSTNWAVADEFKSEFPEVDLQTDKLITDERGIYTNGGAYSFLNLIIYLVEKYYDRQTAIACSKIFQIDIDRRSQAGFIIFKGQKSHKDEMIKQAQAFIENHVNDKISVQQLSDRFMVGRRNFDRRFIKATGNTPLEYAQRVKMESAKRALESSRKTVNEVMFEVGYNDTKAFREVFRKITGLSPQEYRLRFNP